jgi:hypothetical protein
MKLNGVELRKSHFQFGHDPLTFQMESAGNDKGKSATDKDRPSLLGSSVALRKSNFEVA